MLLALTNMIYKIMLDTINQYQKL